MDAANALAHVAGYTAANDLFAHDWMRAVWRGGTAVGSPADPGGEHPGNAGIGNGTYMPGENRLPGVKGHPALFEPVIDVMHED